MKAVLVIDMPSDCDECPLNSHTDYDFDVCWVTKGKGDCPLKPLPKGITNYEVRVSHDYDADYAEGWNDCLEEITK